MSKLTILICKFLVLLSSVNCQSSIFDQKLYEDVLNPELCRQQLNYLLIDIQLRDQFMDAGIRTPRGIMKGNLVDLGNYHQCLAIKEESPTSVIEGKYCTIRIPVNPAKQKTYTIPNLQNVPSQMPIVGFPWMELNPNNTHVLSEELLLKIKFYNFVRAGIESTWGFPQRESWTPDPEMQLAVCIPKSCTAREAIDTMVFNLTAAGLNYYEDTCRLPNDKLWVAADYFAITILSLIGLLTIMSTTYEIIKFLRNKNEDEDTKDIYKSFSLYSNTKTLLSCRVKDKSFGFIAGLKAISVMWIIAAHTHMLHFAGVQANPIGMIEWLTSSEAILITSYHLAMDTLFLITGALSIYNMVGVVDRRKKMLRRIPRYYWFRFRRVLPAVGIMVLLQASLLNHIADGPRWNYVARNTETCRQNWWLTMIQSQTMFKTEDMCLNNAWFVGAESQFYIQSPLIMLGLVAKKIKVHKISNCLSLIIPTILSIIFIFIRNYPSSLFATTRADELAYYFSSYYVSGMFRGGPFFLGAVFGYLLIKFPVRPAINKTVVCSLWVLTFANSVLIIGINYPIVQPNWDMQILDNLFNIFMRLFWGASMGWLLFACARGYGGCINWFLSFKCWKVLGRMYLTMFIVHVPLMHVVNSTAIAPVYFTRWSAMLNFLMNYSLTAIVSFVIMVLVERPFSALSKCLIPEENLPRLTHLTHKSLILSGDLPKTSNANALHVHAGTNVPDEATSRL